MHIIYTVPILNRLLLFITLPIIFALLSIEMIIIIELVPVQISVHATYTTYYKLEMVMQNYMLQKKIVCVFFDKTK